MKEYVLNETRFTFDEKGFLKGMAWRENSFMTRGAGLFDLAQPVKYEYENIRLEPNGAVFAQEGDTLTVTYDKLGPNYTLSDAPELAALEGGVSAVLTLRALSDGRSVSMQLKVTNHAKAHETGCLLTVKT